MIQNENPTIANSLWTATAAPAPDLPPLEGTTEAGTVIIGGGYTGLSAALHLAERGQDVLLLEAETPGWGASGRNGGQVIPGLKEDPDTIEARFGAEMGGRIVALAGGAADLVFDLVRRHGIDCDARQIGWIQPFHDEASRATVTRRVDQWVRRGAPLRLLSRDETEAMLGSSAYVGGMIDGRAGNLHPLNYALGLCRAAIAVGARVHANSRAIAVETAGSDRIVRTGRGAVRARRVILCTNGYTDGLVPPMARTLVPIRSIQIATAPLGDNIRRSILPGGHAASDARRLLLYFRLDAEGRFVMGGRGAYTEAGLRRQMAYLRQRTREIYPQIGDAEWTHAWGGFVAMTADHYPHLTEVAPGMVAALGYNGRGVAMATAMGKVLADWAAGAPAAALDFPLRPPSPIPLHFARRPAVAATVALYRLRDRLGL